jgi:hypothetical protein
MAVKIKRKAKGIYESQNFGIYYEGQIIRRRAWKIRPLTSAAHRIDVSAKPLSLQEAKDLVQAYEVWVRIWVRRHRPFVLRKDVSHRKMVAGNVCHYTYVIEGDDLMSWVATGWIPCRKATQEDFLEYPSVLDA